MTCNFRESICVRFILKVSNSFLWLFRLVIVPFLPCQFLSRVWCIISWCLTPVKWVINHVSSFLFCIWLRFIAAPIVNTIKCIITGILYWGYLVVKNCIVYLAKLIFKDIYKLALILIAKSKEMDIPKKIYDFVVDTVVSITNKILERLTGNQGVKIFLSQLISGAVTGSKDMIIGSVSGGVSGVWNKIKNNTPFLKSNADEKSVNQDNGNEEVVENVAEVTAERKLLNAPDNIQESTIKEPFEEPDSAQATLKSTLKQKLSRNTPTKKTL